MKQDRMIRALVSIHDVMPSTLPEVTELLERCDGYGVDKVTLLVVPGLAWKPSQIEQLRAWQSQGRELAGHGWVHKCAQVSTWTHRLHSLVLSRDVAEHLSLSRAGAIHLVSRCASWFTESGLASPQLYVPPAWALGSLSRSDLQRLPFKTIESLFRLHFPSENRDCLSPLVGFEADTSLRNLALRILNAFSLRIARSTGRVLRIAVHPCDHRLQLAAYMNQILSTPLRSMLYRDLGTAHL